MRRTSPKRFARCQWLEQVSELLAPFCFVPIPVIIWPFVLRQLWLTLGPRLLLLGDGILAAALLALPCVVWCHRKDEAVSLAR